MALQINLEVFLQEFEKHFYPRGGLREETRDGLDYILSHVAVDGIEFYGSIPAIAYTLATAGHESRKIVKSGAKRVVIQFVPVRETLAAKGTRLRETQDRYSPYFGRGLVQVTWHDNYHKIGDYPGIKGYLVKHPTDIGQDVMISGEVLVDNPDLMLDPGLSYLALSYGMRDGLYRPGHKLSTYFSNGYKDYLNARNIVNGGLDAAEDIAQAAVIYERILTTALNTPVTKGTKPLLTAKELAPLLTPQAPPPLPPPSRDINAGDPLPTDEASHIDERAATGKTKIIPIAGGGTVARTAVLKTRLSGKVTAAIGAALTYVSTLYAKIVSLPPSVLIAVIISIGVITAALVIMIIFIKDRREERANSKDLAVMGQEKA